MKVSKICIFVLAVVAMIAACTTYDEAAPNQRKQIENYLTSNELSYVITNDSAYIHLAGNKYGLTDEESRPAGAKKGEKVTFNVEAYEFTSTPSSTPYYTNKRYLAEVISPDLDISFWNFDPIEITIGRGEILKPLEDALDGSLGGDSLAVFLTSSLAYGQEGMGMVKPNTAVMFVLTVEQVEEDKK